MHVGEIRDGCVRCATTLPRAISPCSPVTIRSSSSAWQDGHLGCLSKPCKPATGFNSMPRAVYLEQEAS